MTPWRRTLSVAATLVLAGVLVGATTGLRSLLGPQLGTNSPFMLYVAAVLIAGFLRGPGCGAIVMAASGVMGLLLFLAPDRAPTPAELMALAVFWVVSGLVLLMSNELRLGLKARMDRVRAMADRDDRGLA